MSLGGGGDRAVLVSPGGSLVFPSVPPVKSTGPGVTDCVVRKDESNG